MSTPSSTLRPPTGNLLVDALTNGTYWLLDSSRTLTWALADFGPYQWSSIQNAPTKIGQAYAGFAQFINLKFSYTGTYTRPSTAAADLVSSLDGSWLFFTSGSQAALGYFPNPALSQSYIPSMLQGQYPSAPGDIWLNLNVNAALSLSPGAGGFTTFVHEIGHTLGLKHPHDSGGTGSPTFTSLGISALDVDWFTVMSYDESYPITSLLWHPITPMIGDVIALQSLYGVNLATYSGNNVHQIVNNNVFQTLFDASGDDTLDFSGSGQSWILNLEVAAAGSLGTYDVGLAIPNQQLDVPTSLYWLYGTFESVKGSEQADAISGSSRAEVLIGMGGADAIVAGGGSDFLGGGTGDDIIDGGTGIDFAVFSGFISQYTLQRFGASSVLRGPDGTDTLTNVERLMVGTSQAVAIDLDGNAGMTAKLLGAVFGPSAVANKAFVGIGLNYFDNGWTYTQVADLALDAALGGMRSNASVFDLLYSNTVGSRAPQAVADYWVGQLQSGTMSQSQLAAFAADMQINLDNINFVGLSARGIEYQV